MSINSSAAQLLSGQLSLPFVHDSASLRDRIECLANMTVNLTITDNTANMLSVRKRNNSARLRLHRMFLHADVTILRAIAGFISGEKGCSAVIRNFINKNKSCLENRSVTPPALRPGGSNHCLTKIGDRINMRYFDGRISAGITWGRRTTTRRVRKITLGSYCRATNIIRINPRLDRRTVPVFFVEFIIYHEMLHAELGFSIKNGRRSLHSKEFRLRERQFADYDKAISWEKIYL